jgi:hypothetical protein
MRAKTGEEDEEKERKTMDNTDDKSFHFFLFFHGQRKGREGINRRRPLKGGTSEEPGRGQVFVGKGECVASILPPSILPSSLGLLPIWRACHLGVGHRPLN